MIYWVTVCHAPTRVMAESRIALVETVSKQEATRIDRKIIVDHAYPINEMGTATYVWAWARDERAHLIRPPRNLGGHGGVSYALERFPPAPEDIVFIVDPDSCPESPHWVTAMLKAFDTYKKLGGISLLTQEHKGIQWAEFEPKRDPSVLYSNRPHMFNVSAFRGDVLAGGLKGHSRFYGHVETPMWDVCLRLGYFHGYLKDFKERPNPVAHDREYIEWKKRHAAGNYAGNFDEFMRQPPV